MRGTLLSYKSALGKFLKNPPFRECDEDSFQCWLEKKQELNQKIDRGCRKYADSIDRSGRVVDRKQFLHYGKMVYCIIEKV